MTKTDLDKLCDKIDKMRREMNKKLETMERNFSQRFEAVIKEREEFVERLASLEMENSSLKKRNLFLERELSRNTITINGLSSTNTNASALALNTIKQLNVNINTDDIDDCFQMKSNNNNDNRVALKIKLVRFLKKQEIMRAFTEIKRRDGNFKVEGSRVFINDYLPSDTRVNLQKTKRLLSEKRILASWIFRGQVYVRTNSDLKQRILILKLGDLDTLCGPGESGGTTNESSSSDCLIQN